MNVISLPFAAIGHGLYLGWRPALSYLAAAEREWNMAQALERGLRAKGSEAEGRKARSSGKGVRLLLTRLRLLFFFINCSINCQKYHPLDNR